MAGDSCRTQAWWAARRARGTKLRGWGWPRPLGGGKGGEGGRTLTLTQCSGSVNFDGDTVDAPGRRKDGSCGSGRRRRTAAGLQMRGSNDSRGGLVVDFVSGLTFCLFPGGNELWEDEGAWVALKRSKSKRTRSCLVYSFNNRLLLLLLRV